jgi:hypothetical protein
MFDRANPSYSSVPAGLTTVEPAAAEGHRRGAKCIGSSIATSPSSTQFSALDPSAEISAVRSGFLCLLGQMAKNSEGLL